MRHLILTLLGLCSVFAIYGAGETVLQTKPKEITVYTSSAEITRTSDFIFKNGLQVIVFDSLSPNLLSNSIQIQGDGDYVILDVKYRLKQPDPLKNKPTAFPPRILNEIRLLEDSIRIMSYTIRDYQNQIEVLQAEKNILLNNQLVKGNGGDTIPELKQTLEFFRVKLNNINSEILRLTKELHPYNKEAERMAQRLTDLKQYNQNNNNGNSNQPIPQVLVQIIGNGNGKGNLELKYLVNSAGWHASYDLRASDNQDVKLVYKANVYQNTGKDWQNVPLTLSTLNPLQQYSKPVLPIWYASYTAIVNYESDRKREQRPVSESMQLDEPTTAGQSSYAYNYTQAVANMLNIEYRINLDYNIPSDGQYHTVPIQNKSIKTDLDYYAAPVMDKKAYLIASIVDWQDLELLQGQANIYYNGRYTGQTTIYPHTSNDTMELTLGRTNGIVIEREKLDSDEKPQLVGSWVTQIITYRIKVRNNQPTNVNLKLEDYIPHSNDKDIVVKLLKDSNAKFDENNSHLTWDISLNAGETKEIEFSFSVKYDKEKPLNMVF